MQHRRPFLALFPLLVCSIQFGCIDEGRPLLGYVSGIVTMDGEPVDNIIVIMKPEKGRPAMVRTDIDGLYDIEYTEGEKGTKVGPTRVSLEWPLGERGFFAIPQKYIGDGSELKLDVKSGKQTFNIELKSDEAQTEKSLR